MFNESFIFAVAYIIYYLFISCLESNMVANRSGLRRLFESNRAARMVCVVHGVCITQPTVVRDIHLAYKNILLLGINPLVLAISDNQKEIRKSKLWSE